MEDEPAGSLFATSSIDCRRQYSTIENSLSHTCVGQSLSPSNWSTMHKWGMALTAACKFDAKKQKADHLITFCPICHHLNGACALSAVDKSLVPWLKDTCPAI